jgi:hypothetical protein
MKNVSLILIAMVLAPAAASAQGLPDDPAPASAQSSQAPNPEPAQPGRATRDAFWLRVQQIANGDQVEVTSTYGPPLRCRFAGATDAYLFCDPPGSPEGTGYRFERATVLDVKVVRPPRNWHPGLLSAMIGGGLIVGITATAQTDAGHAAQAGFIGALVSGAIAAPFVFLPPPPDRNAFGVGIAFRPHGFGHRLHLVRPVH